MNTYSIIKDLLLWIEKNLENDLSIDAIAHKSGYSKWHLQRMFRDITGRKIGTYVRERRLTRAAFSIRMTNISIVDVAILYNFESQQSFTRAFKKYFLKTPGYYRQVKDWPMKKLCPPLDIECTELPSPVITYMPDMNLSGVTHSYFCRPDNFIEKSIEHYVNFWTSYLKTRKISGNRLYGIKYFRPGAFNEKEKEILYSTAQVKAGLVKNESDGNTLNQRGGMFIKFIFKGKVTDFLKFIVYIYNTCLPILEVVRRDGCDIEIFHIPEGYFSLEEKITCDYLIPINFFPDTP
ncbi:helix-turn-helix domain-containing protein [Serratia nevei]|uniref:helix-turn-helix domain-containing protein n=1 Tax=Serratia nevei TaxID=2703794 RepID=UPI003F7E2ACE